MVALLAVIAGLALAAVIVARVDWRDTDDCRSTVLHTCRRLNADERLAYWYQRYYGNGHHRLR